MGNTVNLLVISILFLCCLRQSLAKNYRGLNAENCLATMLLSQYPQYGRPVLQVGLLIMGGRHNNFDDPMLMSRGIRTPTFKSGHIYCVMLYLIEITQFL